MADGVGIRRVRGPPNGRRPATRGPTFADNWPSNVRNDAPPTRLARGQMVFRYLFVPEARL